MGQLNNFTTGKISYYTNKSVDPRWGGVTKSGEKFNENLPTAAVPPQLWKMLGGQIVRVHNPSTGKFVDVKVNDTGGFGKKYGRIMDLSLSAFKQIADPKTGVIDAQYELLPQNK